MTSKDSITTKFQPSDKLGDDGLIEDMAQLAFWPEQFVYYAYPWGQDGTPLELFDGPDGWQREVLQEIGVQVRNNAFDGATAVKPVRVLVHSGHGVGKSAMSSWLCDWVRSTRPNSHGTVTANTLKQLKTKTWSAIREWGKLSITSHWFNIKAESLSHAHYPDWRADLQTCNESNSEAFAGQHQVRSTSYYIFDEGSAIPDIVYEVAEGGLTDGEAMQFVFGNPTRNSGVFYEIMRGKKRKYFFVKQVDSRDAKMTNKELIKERIEEYGLSSDYVRVRILGEPPKSDNLQFITRDMAQPAMERTITPDKYYHAPIILGADPAWQGEDYHWIVKRQGMMSWIIGKWRHLPHETVGFTNHLADAETTHKADAVFIDQHGIGGGVYDQMRAQGREPMLVNSNRTDIEKPNQFRNARMENAHKMRAWLLAGGCVPNDPLVIQDLTGPHVYLIESGPHAGKYILESKKDMRARGLDSPGFFDALAYTFDQPVIRRPHSIGDIYFDPEYGHGVLRDTESAEMEYDVYGVS